MPLGVAALEVASLGEVAPVATSLAEAVPLLEVVHLVHPAAAHSARVARKVTRLAWLHLAEVFSEVVALARAP